MREYGFELRLCARLEAEGALIARQLGGGVTDPGNRVLDVVDITPGATFEARARITDRTIPAPVIDADVGPGRAVYWKDAVRALDLNPDRARAAIDRGIEIGVLEPSRRNGRTYVRQVCRYPADWFGRIRAIENKPDLGDPGALRRQLRTDVALRLADEVVLATRSHVTRAHLNRIPSEVGVWRVRGDGIEVVRDPEPLSVEAPGVELLEEHPGRVDIEIVGADALARARRSLAERAYGKGWRPSEWPGCDRARVASLDGVEGLPWCGHYERVVDPGRDCGPDCPVYTPAEPTAVDPDRARDATSPWVAEPKGRAKKQSGLDGFG